MKLGRRIACTIVFAALSAGVATPALARPMPAYGWRCDPYSINGRYVAMSCDKLPAGGPGTKFRTIGVCVGGSTSAGPWVLPGYTSTAYCDSYPYEAYMQHN